MPKPPHEIRATKRTAAFAARVVLCLFLTGVSASAEVRTWTDGNGRTFQGDLVRVDGLSAVLAVDGKECRFPLANLSADDKLFVFRWRRAQLPAPAATPGPSAFFDRPAAGPSGADVAFNAYNAAFLSKANGRTFYKKSTAKSESTGTWVLALEIQLAEDVYERTHSGVHRQLVSDLLNSFVAKEGTNWSYDSWNDDIAWMVIACVRGYEITRNPVLLRTAESQWKMAYDRGWDNTFGGGIWEDNHTKFSKCALSNDPMIISGCALYRSTHDATYLKRCQEIYAWVHDNVFDQATGQVNEGIARDGKQVSDNVYNTGCFINAANCLHNATGAANYYNDAVLAADHVVRKYPILSHNGRGDNCWSDQFARGLGNLCRDNNLWDRYHAWMVANAKSAWTSRRVDLNVTWNDWKTPTPSDDCSSFECLGAVVLQQMMPPAP